MYIKYNRTPYGLYSKVEIVVKGLDKTLFICVTFATLLTPYQ